jgi:hypothetical protein
MKAQSADHNQATQFNDSFSLLHLHPNLHIALISVSCGKAGEEPLDAAGAHESWMRWALSLHFLSSI